MFQNQLVLIKGAGDLATGVAYRLHRSGFPVCMTEIATPLTVRRSVAFAQAIFSGRHSIAGVNAKSSQINQIDGLLEQRIIPILVDPGAQAVGLLKPVVLVDAIMAKYNTGTAQTDAPLVVALGPGFQCGLDCHVVIETNRGHSLGRALWSGQAETDTGQPGDLPGVKPTMSRVLRSPIAGHVNTHVEIGAFVPAAALIATVQGAHGDEAEIRAPFAGLLRGIVHVDVAVMPGMKIADLDPRGKPEYCQTISDKALAVGGGVLEAILTAIDCGQLNFRRDYCNE